jgi:hypothetical protein
MINRTHTKTYAQLDSWAQSFPWDCLVRETNCVSATHDHSPMVGDPCAVPECREPIRERESCYLVTQYGRVTGPPPQNPQGPVREREQYVCWRHVHPDEGPKLYPKSEVS